MKRYERLLLGALLMASLLARLPRLGESLWYDEIASLRDYVIRGPSYIVANYFDPSNHVLQSLLSWCSLTLFDGVLEPALALRTPSLLFSIATVGMMYGLVRRTVSPRAAAPAATLCGAAPVVILSGTEARGYAGMMFFSTAMTWQMFELIERPRGGAALVYGILAGLGAWIHLTTVFVPIGHTACLLVRRAHGEQARALRAGLIAIASGAFFTLALYAPILGRIASLHGTFAGADSIGPSLVGTEGAHALYQLGGSWSWWAAAPGLVVIAIGAARLRTLPRARLAALLAIAGAPIMIVAIAAAGAWCYARFMLFCVPAGLLLMALGLDALLVRGRAVGAAGLIVVLGGWATDLVTRPPKQPVREAVQYVDTYRTAAEGVLLIGLRAQVTDFYTLPLDWHPAAFSWLHGADLEQRLEAARPGWVVMIYEDSVSADRKALLQARGFVESARFEGWVDWGKGDVVVLARGLNRDATPR